MTTKPSRPTLLSSFPGSEAPAPSPEGDGFSYGSAMNFNTHEQVVEAARTLPQLKSMPREDFVSWLADNPEMYRAFRGYAIAAIQKGRTKFSCYMIRERVRWYTQVEWGGEFKISNNVTPYMSRLLARDIPVLDGIFNRLDVDMEEFMDYQRRLL